MWFGPSTVNDVRGSAGCVVRARISGMLPVSSTPQNDLERSISKDMTHWDVDCRLNSTELGLSAYSNRWILGGQAVWMNLFGVGNELLHYLGLSRKKEDFATSGDMLVQVPGTVVMWSVGARRVGDF
jgi:hypothetical protein